MRATIGLVLLCFLALGTAGGARPPAAPPANAAPTAATTAAASAYDFSWSRAPLWDDGQAEVSLYRARRPQYGKIESYEALFIVVKEDFNPSLHVKADNPQPGRSLPVLKLNQVHSYWTPRYPYHFLASVFVRRDRPPDLVKLTVGSQEWCGNTFKEVQTWGGRPQLVFHTYFDGEGDGAGPLAFAAGDLFEDQLPLALRSLAFAPGLTLRTRIVPSLISNNLRRPLDPVPATVTVVGEEKLATAGAGTRTAWKVSLAMGQVEQTWWFAKEAPHTLLRMDSSDGRAWLLKATTRKPYWKVATYRPAM